MFDWKSGRSTYVVALYPDDTPAIDFVLDEGLVKKIYAAWDEKEYGALMDYGGGVKAITVKMLLGAGDNLLLNIKGIGSVRAADIVKQARGALEESPYDSGI